MGFLDATASVAFPAAAETPLLLPTLADTPLRVRLLLSPPLPFLSWKGSLVASGVVNGGGDLVLPGPWSGLPKRPRKPVLLLLPPDTAVVALASTCVSRLPRGFSSCTLAFFFVAEGAATESSPVGPARSAAQACTPPPPPLPPVVSLLLNTLPKTPLTARSEIGCDDDDGEEEEEEEIAAVRLPLPSRIPPTRLVKCFGDKGRAPFGESLAPSLVTFTPTPPPDPNVATAAAELVALRKRALIVSPSLLRMPCGARVWDAWLALRKALLDTLVTVLAARLLLLSVCSSSLIHGKRKSVTPTGRGQAVVTLAGNSTGVCEEA